MPAKKPATAKTVPTADSLLQKAPEVLKAVDSAHAFHAGQLSKRDFPTFQRKELQLASRKLGSGGFGIVYEVEGFTLNGDSDPKEEALQKGDGITSEEFTQDIHQSLLGQAPDQATEEHYHYDIDTAKVTMKRRCLRFKQARYALKHLRPDLSELDRARGMIDLAIEITYLRALWHPNIIKMRAVSDTPRVSADTFLILDRLFGTLEDKYDEWNTVYKANKGGPAVFGKRGRNDKILTDLLKDRLVVAYDLTQAFHYLHNQRVLYRDIKPENFGFDVRGDVKVFDFGLARSLERDDKAKGYGYHLTKVTGSIPYMAPEVAKGEPYAQEADVFSLSIVLWEILSLKWAFNGYHYKEYVINVVRKKERLAIKKSWPSMVRAVLPEAWDHNPQRRPTMKRFGSLLRGVLEDVSPDDSVINNRTQHMLNRSKRSMHVTDQQLRLAATGTTTTNQ